MDPADGRSQGAKIDATSRAQHRPLLHSDRRNDNSSARTWERWEVLFAIFFSLLIGLAFALGHHFMNKYVFRWVEVQFEACGCRLAYHSIETPRH
jgi:hypothetical protein